MALRKWSFGNATCDRYLDVFFTFFNGHKKPQIKLVAIFVNWIATPSPNYVGNPGRHRTRKPMAYRVSCYTHSRHLNIPRSFKIVIYLILEHIYTSSIKLCNDLDLDKYICSYTDAISLCWADRVLRTTGCRVRTCSRGRQGPPASWTRPASCAACKRHIQPRWQQSRYTTDVTTQPRWQQSREEMYDRRHHPATSTAEQRQRSWK